MNNKARGMLETIFYKGYEIENTDFEKTYFVIFSPKKDDYILDKAGYYNAFESLDEAKKHIDEIEKGGKHEQK